ncbi:MAG: penicillin acylase family protein [Myxococcota bacterium]|nr:penicillin acylase family protein [Myxococcota bacterium]
MAGFAFVGTPAVQLGHNRHVAWTATTTYPDWMDLVEVRVSTEGGLAIELAGARHPAVARTEVVNVRGEPPQEVEVIDVPGVGIVLPEDFSPLPITRPGRRILFRWTGLKPTIEAHAFHALDTARNLDEANAAIDAMELGAFNFVVADASGLSYRSRPLVPDRGTPGSTPRSWVLIDGEDPNAAWSGTFLDGARLPTSSGGERGWIATANNDPFGFTRDGSVEGDAWYYGVWYDPGTRGARLDAELARLAERGDVTPEDFVALQRDTYSMFAERFLPLLFDAADALDTDEALAEFRERDDLAQLVDRLRGWDRRMDRDSAEAVIFQAWVYFAVQDAIGDELGLLFQPLLDAVPRRTLRRRRRRVRVARPPRHVPRPPRRPFRSRLATDTRRGRNRRRERRHLPARRRAGRARHVERRSRLPHGRELPRGRPPRGARDLRAGSLRGPGLAVVEQHLRALGGGRVRAARVRGGGCGSADGGAVRADAGGVGGAVKVDGALRATVS